MTDIPHGTDPGENPDRLAGLSEKAALWLMIATLAWAPFPLGSARPWAWSLLVLMVALCWLAWLPSALRNPKAIIAALRRGAIPLSLLGAVLAWAVIQASSWTPESWHHPIWQSVRESLGGGRGAISLNPFDTMTETMKLLSCVVMGWLAFNLGQRHDNANRILLALFVIGLIYAIYGIILGALGTSQISLLEGAVSQYGSALSGPFGAKNSFATFCGMSFIIAVGLLVRAGSGEVVARRGPRALLRTAIQFVFGRGLVWIIGALITLYAMIGAGSRGGLVATFLGVAVAFVISLRLAARKRAFWQTILGGLVALAIFLGLLVLNGAPLIMRFDTLMEIGNGNETIELRPAVWASAVRSIKLHPWEGIGLGAYHDAYHLYATQFIPFVVDRAHNDYLEFAAGIGLPAAAAWLLALAFIVGQCARGAFRRQHRQTYCIVAIGVSVLLAVHSAVDFSLQMPAIALMYAVILGIGAAQSVSTRQAAGSN
jgi:O-antigen ligase